MFMYPIFCLQGSSLSNRFMAEVQVVLKAEPFESPLRKLKLRWYNQKADYIASPTTPRPILEFVTHGKGLRYNSVLSARTFLHYVNNSMVEKVEDIPSKQIQDVEDLHGFFSESLRSLLLVDECGWAENYTKFLEAMFWQQQERNTSSSNKDPLDIKVEQNPILLSTQEKCESETTKESQCPPEKFSKFKNFFNVWQSKAAENYLFKDNIRFGITVNSTVFLKSFEGGFFNKNCSWSVLVFTPESVQRVSVLCEATENFWFWLENLPSPPLKKVPVNLFLT